VERAGSAPARLAAVEDLDVAEAEVGVLEAAPVVLPDEDVDVLRLSAVLVGAEGQPKTESTSHSESERSVIKPGKPGIVTFELKQDRVSTCLRRESRRAAPCPDTSPARLLRARSSCGHSSGLMPRRVVPAELGVRTGHHASGEGAHALPKGSRSAPRGEDTDRASGSTSRGSGAQRAATGTRMRCEGCPHGSPRGAMRRGLRGHPSYPWA